PRCGTYVTHHAARTQPVTARCDRRQLVKSIRGGSMTKRSARRLSTAVCAAVLASIFAVVSAHDAPARVSGQTGDQSMEGMVHGAEGGNGADLGPGLFAAADRNTDGAVTRAEFKATLDKWFTDADKGKSDAVSDADLMGALQRPQPRLPLDSHLKAMLAAVPNRPAAKPA